LPKDHISGDDRRRREVGCQLVGFERRGPGSIRIAVDQRLRLGREQHGSAAVGGIALDLPCRLLRLD